MRICVYFFLCSRLFDMSAPFSIASCLFKKLLTYHTEPYTHTHAHVYVTLQSKNPFLISAFPKWLNNNCTAQTMVITCYFTEYRDRESMCGYIGMSLYYPIRLFVNKSTRNLRKPTSRISTHTRTHCMCVLLL